ncbi:lipoyl(octanoyl) transferase LipB [Rudanella paleaurantiibacter]|uniref:Octanoyltransferase n=1 Tax=Rudanella paleaurantiibacter TaxID=2614655 RepID=A0A7J5U2C4_9BACT|nr:lipoyl(octanoyl) transferase LipB [Rudanella paleaurantiibacter]KAB7731831.1 lipoyl(octanoyl) transferase LipB [Rudanella paleaurantiibacter]
MNKKVQVQHWGLIDYQEAWDRQEGIFADTLAQKVANRGRSAEEQLPTSNYLIFCEHPHVYTLGKSGHETNLLANDDFLKTIGATYHRINRGGDITYHGPGQLVGYPILDLDNFFTDIHRYMRLLEEAVIRTLADYGLVAGRIEGTGSERLTGVWLGEGVQAGGLATTGPARKICAMGVKASRWVTMHGFALNVNTDLSYFGHIVPCGITDKAVTSLSAELGRPVDMAQVAGALQRHLATLFEMELV